MPRRARRGAARGLFSSANSLLPESAFRVVVSQHGRYGRGRRSADTANLRQNPQNATGKCGKSDHWRCLPSPRATIAPCAKDFLLPQSHCQKRLMIISLFARVRCRSLARPLQLQMSEKSGSESHSFSLKVQLPPSTLPTRARGLAGLRVPAGPRAATSFIPP